MTKTDVDTRELVRVAQAHGLSVKFLHHSATAADIFCASCGWPEAHRETSMAQYLVEPYRCAQCVAAKERERTG